MMRILVVGRCLPKSGSSSGSFEFEQARALARRGHEVVYCFSDNRSIRANRHIALGRKQSFSDGLASVGSVIPLGGFPYAMLTPIKSYGYQRCIERLDQDGFKPDIAYVHFPALVATDALLDYFATRSVPFICMEHWTKVQNRTLPKSRVQLLRRIAAQTKRFCCVSDDLADSAAMLTGLKREEIEVIPNLISSVIYQYKAEAGSGHEKAHFVFAGRLELNKQINLLIEAFSQMKQREAVLTIVGSGSQEKKLKRMSASCCLEERVSFLGWLTSENLADLYRNSDCFVSPSDTETFCVPVVEAWLCGIPCICADNSPLRREFDATNGILFSKNDPVSLASALDQMCERRASYDRAMISKRAIKRFSEASVVNQIERVLEACCKGCSVKSK